MLFGHPSSRVAAAGNSAFRSDVVVKKTAAMSLVSIWLACVISTSNSSVAAKMLSLLFAETVMAPLMPQHCNSTSLLLLVRIIAYSNCCPLSTFLLKPAAQLLCLSREMPLSGRAGRSQHYTLHTIISQYDVLFIMTVKVFFVNTFWAP